MLELTLPPKLEKYLNKLTTETGRPIKFHEVSSFGIPGMKAAFSVDPYYILIKLLSGSQSTDPGVEQSIAHEATHGFLIYKKGYSYPIFESNLAERDKKQIGLLLTMVEDIVVNKILQDEDFLPFSPQYLSEVQKETKAARKGKDYYRVFSEDLLIKDRFMVFRYILAWGTSKYINLKLYERKSIKNFLKSFEKSYPRQGEMANEVKKLILQNDIFTPEGHRIVIKAILNLWGLESLVELETFI